MRLIDADKLLEKTECLFKDLNSIEDFMGIGYNHGVGDSIAIIKNAPTIEAEPVKHGRWIPVSERLPEQGQEVICQCRASIITVLKLDANGNWYQYVSHCYMRGFVIAWMPLPEPYKGEGEAYEVN